jgi:hypothetical protein
MHDDAVLLGRKYRAGSEKTAAAEGEADDG